MTTAAAHPSRRQRSHLLRVLAGTGVGLALGATAAAGNALLLYTGQGFLRAAGLLFASTIMALAAGVWAGAPENADERRAPRSRTRWFALMIVLLLGGFFTLFWGGRADVRGAPTGGAVAVLLIVAVPAYTAGALLSALHARQRALHGGVAAGAMAGSAAGVLLATTFLIQNLEPYGVYYAAAALVALCGIIETRVRTGGAGDSDMNGRVAIVTGVGDREQLGFTLARALLDAGAAVVVTGRTEHVRILAAELQAAGRVSAVVADLAVDDDVARVVQAAHDGYGRLDALFNVAGGLSVTGSIAETTPELWREEMARNAETALRMSRAALPLLRNTRGAIVNFASPAGLKAVAELGAYSASKAAVVALTRALALEERQHGVRVNAIAPGLMDTGQNRRASGDDARYVSRDDIARLALFLAGPDAAAVTGETITATA